MGQISDFILPTMVGNSWFFFANPDRMFMLRGIVHIFALTVRLIVRNKVEVNHCSKFHQIQPLRMKKLKS
jgi:hypothetical protein